MGDGRTPLLSLKSLTLKSLARSTLRVGGRRLLYSHVSRKRERMFPAGRRLITTRRLLVGASALITMRCSREPSGCDTLPADLPSCPFQPVTPPPPAAATSTSSIRPVTVVYLAQSLDGYIARLDGGLDWFPYPNDDSDEDLGWAEFFAGINAVLTDEPTGADSSPEPPSQVLDNMGREGITRVYLDGWTWIHSLLRDDLVDEMIITTVPVLIGDGVRLFPPGAITGSDKAWIVDGEPRVYPGGLVKVTYRRDRTREFYGRLREALAALGG